MAFAHRSRIVLGGGAGRTRRAVEAVALGVKVDGSLVASSRGDSGPPRVAQTHRDARLQRVIGP